MLKTKNVTCSLRDTEDLFNYFYKQTDYLHYVDINFEKISNYDGQTVKFTPIRKITEEIYFHNVKGDKKK